MPTAEDRPRIDPTVKHVGVSKLRGLNAQKLRNSTETFVIQEKEQPLAVLLTYDRFMAMQQELDAVGRTVDLLSDAAEMDALRAGLADTAAGRFRSLASIDADLRKGRG